MKQKGFTLIEVIVVMTMIAIMAGVMVPFAYKTWENMQTSDTQEKMMTIKRAIFGDLNMNVEGNRTLHSFVLDNGELPNDMVHPLFAAQKTLSDDLMSNPAADPYPNWKGPYILDNNYKKDAWGQTFIYKVKLDSDGRRISAELRSSGLDRTPDTADDIVILMDVQEAIQYSSTERTRQKMEDIKKALVGDKSLVQNGIRTHFGFVGECGGIPNSDKLDDLINPSADPDYKDHVNCNNKKPYIFDAAEYKKDAWGTDIKYTRVSRAITTMKSAGPDRTFNTADDLDLQIDEAEVTPTNTMRGNVAITFTNNSLSDKNSGAYYVGVMATYDNTLEHEATMSSSAPHTQLPLTTIVPAETRTVSTALNVTFPNKLPVGKVLLSCRLCSDSGCSTVLESAKAVFFVHDNIISINMNCPAMSHTILQTGP